MGAPSKRAKKTRVAAEFDIRRISNELRAPRETPTVYCWTLAEIFTARDEQMRGRFRLAARMAESMRTDDALFVARTNRLAPQRSIEVAIEPAKVARAKPIAGEAEALFGAEGIAITAETIADIHGCLVDHGVSFANAFPLPREDGSRTDYAVKAWPIEHVWWDAFARCFKTRTEDGVEETIVHGDGRWIVFAKNEIEPFKHGAIVPGAIVWARHAHAIRDWAKGSVAHGNAKFIGEMPTGVPLQDENGNTAEAVAFLALLRDLLSGDGPAGIRPAGSKTEFVTNTSTAWQVFSELVGNGEKAAARIYLGTDGTLGATGGAPGVDIQALFGVAATIVEGDLECLERGFKTGVIDPWCAINFGDSSLAPARRYILPDPDADAVKASLAARSAAFYADLKAAKEAGIPLTQDLIDGLAGDYAVRAPQLAAVVAPPAAAAPPASAPALRSVRT